MVITFDAAESLEEKHFVCPTNVLFQVIYLYVFVVHILEALRRTMLSFCVSFHYKMCMWAVE